MKKYSSVITLCSAILFGVLAVVMANRWLAGHAGNQSPEKKISIGTVVIAAEDIRVGTPITKERLTTAQWPKANIPRGAFEDMNAVEGRVAITRLSAGEPLLDAELAAPGSGAGLVARIPIGMRAMSIRVDEVVGVSGFILPNCYVDVIGVDTERGDATSVKTILRHIEVLAIAQETYTEDGQAKVVKTVTLQLTPEQSEKLALHTHQGAVHLVLRNPLDEEKAPIASPKPNPVAVARRPEKSVPHAVEVIRGSERVQVRFKNGESEEMI